MRIRKRALSLALCLLLALGPLAPAAGAQGESLSIGSLEDWAEFVRQCRLDTWSQGKTVVLTCDLELTGEECVPTFGGAFDGGGHTVSGLRLTGEGSQQGLFRYVQEGAEITNLTVVGRVAPAGSAKYVGGIAGINAGTIARCSFRGSVAGSGGVGGIAGCNEAAGQLVNCTAYGAVTGEHYTGGVAGENYGSIVSCTNEARVNTQEAEVSPELDSLELQPLNRPENLPACTDTGGIAGYSKGILQSCVNRGAVGYPHTGYNVGGIVGRQSGRVDGCVNYGAVQGRKEVGGIAGQMEPYVLLQFEEDTLQKLERELDTLSALLDRTLDTTQDTGRALSGHVTQLTGLAEEARADVSEMAGHLEDWGQGTVDTANELSARVARTLDQAVPAAGDLEEAADRLSRGIREIRAALETLEGAEGDASIASTQVQRALSSLERAMDQVKQAQIRAGEALRLLPDSLGSDRQLAQAAAEWRDALSELSGAFSQAAQAVAELIAALPEGEVSGALQAAGEALSALGGAVGRMAQAAGEIAGALSAHRWEPRQSLDLILEAMDALSEGGDDLQNSVIRLRRAVAALDGVREAALESAQELETAFDTLAGGSDAMASAFDRLEEILDQRAGEPDLVLPDLESGFYQREDHLNATLEGLLNAVDAMNETAERSGDDITERLRAVNRQMDVIAGVLQEAWQDPEEEYVVDASREDTGAGWGWVSSCENHGPVGGDVNIGGIIGAMAVEYDFDPEDDVTSQGGSSARFQYRTSAVLQDCVNEGGVTARKDCAGGVVGRMDLGLVRGCGGTGAVESTGGEYVGGVAGAAYAAIQDCWAKCRLTGTRQVGGIAGLGYEITGCRTLVEIAGGLSAVGAIAGTLQEAGSLSQNWFVSESLGGVDGISYAGRAEGLDYASFRQLENLPSAFEGFTLTFLAGDVIVDRRTFSYGARLDPADLPEVPERTGFYGRWNLPPAEPMVFDTVIEAGYSPWRTALSGGEGRVLAEGRFGPEAVLWVEAGDALAPGGVAGWNIRLPEGEFTALRLALPEEEGDFTVWSRTERGDWQRLPHTREGSYLRVELAAQEAQVCLVPVPPNPAPWVGLAAGGAVIAGGLWRRKARRKRARK